MEVAAGSISLSHHSHNIAIERFASSWWVDVDDPGGIRKMLLRCHIDIHNCNDRYCCRLGSTLNCPRMLLLRTISLLAFSLAMGKGDG